jgi:hypothetical protein
MEVITAHLPMRDRVLAGLQSSAAGTRPRPQPALRRPEPLRYRKAARLALEAPPTHRGHGGPPRCHLPAPTHRVGPIMHPMPWLRAMCIHHGQMETMPGITHHHPSWKPRPASSHLGNWNLGRHLPTSAMGSPCALPFQPLGFGVSVAAMQRWLLFVCNLRDVFDDAVDCNTSIARLMQARDCRHA